MMELSRYLNPIIKWWWLIVGSMLIAAVSSFLIVRNQPNVYQAHSTLMIGNFIENPNPNSNEYYVAQQLAASYADIANRDLIQSETIKALNLSVMPANFTRAIPNTSLIEISVNDTDPKRAQVVANELANQLIKHSPTGTKPEDVARQAFINEQLDKLQIQINDTQNEIEKLQQQLGELSGAQEISNLQTQITAQQQKFSSLQSNYASLLVTSQKGATNSLTVIEQAGLPTSPISPNRILITGLAAGMGLVISSLAVYGIDFLDDTIKTDEEISAILDAPVLGHIGEIDASKSQLIFIKEEPRSPISDAFRLLRTNIEFILEQNEYKVIMVSSPEASDGKSIISINLATSMAQSDGKNVLLIDSDLRRPTLHKFIGLPNEVGLSDICLGKTKVTDAIKPGENGDVNFIPAGTPPPSPVELISTYTMNRTLNELRSLADIVILDCPPIFLADTIILSKKVDGIVIVVSFKSNP